MHFVEVRPDITRAVVRVEVLGELGEPKWIVVASGLRFGVPQVFVMGDEYSNLLCSDSRIAGFRTLSNDHERLGANAFNGAVPRIPGVVSGVPILRVQDRASEELAASGGGSVFGEGVHGGER
jgi:hypothetical protein